MLATPEKTNKEGGPEASPSVFLVRPALAHATALVCASQLWLWGCCRNVGRCCVVLCRRDGVGGCRCRSSGLRGGARGSVDAPRRALGSLHLDQRTVGLAGCDDLVLDSGIRRVGLGRDSIGVGGVGLEHDGRWVGGFDLPLRLELFEGDLFFAVMKVPSGFGPNPRSQAVAAWLEGEGCWRWGRDGIRCWSRRRHGGRDFDSRASC